MKSFYQHLSISEFYLSCIPGGVRANYELRVSPPNFNESFCPGLIELTCISQNAPRILNWFINGSSVAQYTFNQVDSHFINIMDSSINIAIVNVTSKSSIISIIIWNMYLDCGEQLQIIDKSTNIILLFNFFIWFHCVFLYKKF